MLRTKYIDDVHKEYRDVVQALNLVADALRSIDGDEMYVGDGTAVFEVDITNWSKDDAEFEPEFTGYY